jgi:hypothetical protein
VDFKAHLYAIARFNFALERRRWVATAEVQRTHLCRAPAEAFTLSLFSVFDCLLVVPRRLSTLLHASNECIILISVHGDFTVKRRLQSQPRQTGR